MKRMVLVLVVGAAWGVLVVPGEAVDAEYQQFLRKQRNQFEAFKAGRIDPESAKEEATAVHYMKAAQSYYDVLTQPGGGDTPEEQHAWRLYRSYKKTFEDEASARASLSRAQQDARALGYGFGAPFALDPKDVGDIRDAKLAVNKAIEQRQNLADAWDRHFGGYYGSLDEMSETYVLKAPDPSDPLKTHTVELDKIEYRLRSFPYSQRRSTKVDEPETANVVPTPLPRPTTDTTEAADTRAGPDATVEDAGGDSPGPVGRVPVPDEYDTSSTESDSDEAIRVEQPDEDAGGTSWEDMTPEERRAALKDNDPEAWERIRRDLAGDEEAAPASPDVQSKPWEAMTPAERHEALKENDDRAWEAVRVGLKGGDPDAVDAINEALSPPQEDDDEFTVQDVIDAANRATGNM